MESKERQVLESMNADEESAKILGEYLGYSLGKDPIDPTSDNRIMFTDKTDDKNIGVIAVKPLPDLTPKSTTVEIRRLFEKVIEIKDEFGTNFSVEVVGFIGKKRLVFFPTLGNRDTRLDLMPETIDIPLYKVDLGYLKNSQISVKTSPFGFGDDIHVDDRAFRKELSNHFLSVVSMYRKKLSEWITASDLKVELSNLVSDKPKKDIQNNNIESLVQNESYKSVLSTVVDTITLRQLMRRFLEGYYGADSFNVDDIALGVGSGTLDEAIEKAANIAKNIGEEREIKKINRQHTAIGQLDLFSSSFTPEEEKATTKVQIKDGEDDYLADLSKKALKQFQLAYGGDLFAGSIGDAATKIENKLAKENKIDWVKLYADTRAGNYSFKFSDMPPEAIEKQYEDSMSKNVQIILDKKTNEPVVFYGDDEVEQKNKGAYYTDQRFVDYMVDKTVSIEFQNRYRALKKAIKENDKSEIQKKLDYLLDLKVADFSCGGGSFLRGAFLKIAEKYPLIAGLSIPDEIKAKYSFLNGDENSQFEWENYILNNMIYGVDIDYKAIIISSLTLTLSSLQNRPKNTKLPQLIGKTLIHQNSLINAVPYYKRKEIFGRYQSDIAKLIKLKKTDFSAFTKLRDKLQAKVIPEAGEVSDYASMLDIQSIELNLPEVYFNEDGTLKAHGGMDIVIGNPPWEVWTPNADEFFSEYDKSYRSLATKKLKKAREKKLFDTFPDIKEKWKEEKKKYIAGSKYFNSKQSLHFQNWIVEGKKSPAHINLYKISLERFAQLAKKTARISILVPDNFATDNGSSGLRHMVIDNYNLREVLSFENRKNIFQSVDNRYKFICLSFDGKKGERTNSFKTFFYRQDLRDLNNEIDKFNYSIKFLKTMNPDSYALTETRNQAEFDLFVKIQTKYEILRESKILKFAYDYNKTYDVEQFVSSNNKNKDLIPLYEGKFMNQFAIYPNKIKFYVTKKDTFDKVQDMFSKYRIALRTIASATNKRSLIATILPKNSTSANSLLEQRLNIPSTIDERLFYLGFLNSYVEDFILRQLISVNINQIYLKQLPLPKISDISDSSQINQIVKELLKENKGYYEDLDELLPGNEYADKSHDELIAELNARVMIDFKLTRGEVVTLMKTFESANHKKDVRDETQRILDCYDALTK